MAARVNNGRREALLASRWHARAGSPGLASAFKGVQLAGTPATPLAAGFPAQAALAAAGYVVAEDLDGADVDELIDAGLSVTDARAVIAALGG